MKERLIAVDADSPIGAKGSAPNPLVALAALRPVRHPAQRRGGGIPLANRACSNRPGLPHTRQRMECGVFSAALVRAPSCCAASSMKITKRIQFSPDICSSGRADLPVLRSSPAKDGPVSRPPHVAQAGRADLPVSRPHSWRIHRDRNTLSPIRICYSILHPPSSILNPQSSILNPQSSILNRHPRPASEGLCGPARISRLLPPTDTRLRPDAGSGSFRVLRQQNGERFPQTIPALNP